MRNVVATKKNNKNNVAKTMLQKQCCKNNVAKTMLQKQCCKNNYITTAFVTMQQDKEGLTQEEESALMSNYHYTGGCSTTCQDLETSLDEHQIMIY